MENFLNINELTKKLKTDKSVITDLIIDKEIPFYSPTVGLIIFNEDEINNWIESSKIMTKSESEELSYLRECVKLENN